MQVLWNIAYIQIIFLPRLWNGTKLINRLSSCKLGIEKYLLNNIQAVEPVLQNAEFNNYVYFCVVCGDPDLAIRGSCFLTECGQLVEKYAFCSNFELLICVVNVLFYEVYYWLRNSYRTRTNFIVFSKMLIHLPTRLFVYSLVCERCYSKINRIRIDAVLYSRRQLSRLRFCKSSSKTEITAVNLKRMLVNISPIMIFLTLLRFCALS